MVYTLGKDAQKSIRNPIIPSERTAFRNFWGTTATDNQYQSSTLNGFSGTLFIQKPNTHYGGTAVVISTCEPESESMTRHQINMGNAEQPRT
jgi:hypothetical protein